MQVIKNTIKVYFNNAKKLDFILKYAYNKNKDIKCVGAGVGDRGGTYLLFLHSDSLLEAIELWENRFTELKESLREY